MIVSTSLHPACAAGARVEKRDSLFLATSHSPSSSSCSPASAHCCHSLEPPTGGRESTSLITAATLGRGSTSKSRMSRMGFAEEDGRALPLVLASEGVAIEANEGAVEGTGGVTARGARAGAADFDAGAAAGAAALPGLGALALGTSRTTGVTGGSSTRTAASTGLGAAAFFFFLLLDAPPSLVDGAEIEGRRRSAAPTDTTDTATTSSARVVQSSVGIAKVTRLDRRSNSCDLDFDALARCAGLDTD